MRKLSLEKRKNKAIFLDRDGVINRNIPYCSRPEDFELLPGIPESISLLNKSGFKVIVITNQSGIGRGLFTREILDKIHEKMHSELSKYGAHLDAIYYCPHHPDEHCNCRKPSTKMLSQAVSNFNIDLSQSYVIGDSQIDIEMGRKAGCRIFLISSDSNQSKTDSPAIEADYVVSDVLSAASIIASNIKLR